MNSSLITYSPKFFNLSTSIYTKELQSQSHGPHYIHLRFNYIRNIIELKDNMVYEFS